MIKFVLVVEDFGDNLFLILRIDPVIVVDVVFEVFAANPPLQTIVYKRNNPLKINNPIKAAPSVAEDSKADYIKS